MEVGPWEVQAPSLSAGQVGQAEQAAHVPFPIVTFPHVAWITGC